MIWVILSAAGAFITAIFLTSPKDVASTDHSVTIVPVVSPESAPATTPIVHPMIQRWATAVAHWEGANPLNCNPGNLKYSTLTASWGATKGPQASDGGHLCKFATPQAGMAALVNFLTLGAEGELIISHPWPCTLHDFTVRFAGNPPAGYINGICTMLAVSPTVLISIFLT